MCYLDNDFCNTYNIDKEKCMNNQVDNENNVNDDIDDDIVNEASAPSTNTMLDEQNVI